MFEISPTIRESASQEAPLPTSKADLIIATKALVTAINNTSRQVADNLATMRDRHSMSQRDIAAAMGKSQPWVQQMLEWHDGGFKTETPFGPASMATRKRAKRAEKPSDQATDQATDRRPIIVPPELVRHAADDLSESEPAEERPEPTSKPKRAPCPKNPPEQSASEKALAEVRWGNRHYLPLMTPADRQAARDDMDAVIKSLAS
jgi:hypothetical protein